MTIEVRQKLTNSKKVGLPNEVKISLSQCINRLRAIKKNNIKKLEETDVKNQVIDICKDFHNNLYQSVIKFPEFKNEIGEFAFDIAFPFMMLSLLNNRAYFKPKGYPGDFETMEVVYQNLPRGIGRIGKYIDEWVLNINSSQGVRNRWKFLVQEIFHEYQRWNKDIPMLVTNLACGSAREVFDFFEEHGEAEVSFTNIDIDKDAIKFGKRRSKEINVESKVKYYREDLIKLMYNKKTISLPKQQLIYANGLVDYFNDELFIQLLNWVYDSLLPSGKVIVGQIFKENPDRPYIEYIMDWKLIYRDHEDLKKLFSKSKFNRSLLTFTLEESKSILFVTATK